MPFFYFLAPTLPQDARPQWDQYHTVTNIDGGDLDTHHHRPDAVRYWVTQGHRRGMVGEEQSKLRSIA